MGSGDTFCSILLLGLLLLVVFFSSEAMVMGTRNVCSCCFISSGRWGQRCKSGAGRNEAPMQEEEIGGQRSKESRTLVCHGKAQSVLFVGIRYLPQACSTPECRAPGCSFRWVLSGPVPRRKNQSCMAIWFLITGGSFSLRIQTQGSSFFEKTFRIREPLVPGISETSKNQQFSCTKEPAKNRQLERRVFFSFFFLNWEPSFSTKTDFYF